MALIAEKEWLPPSRLSGTIPGVEKPTRQPRRRKKAYLHQSLQAYYSQACGFNGVFCVFRFNESQYNAQTRHRKKEIKHIDSLPIRHHYPLQQEDFKPMLIIGLLYGSLLLNYWTCFFSRNLFDLFFFQANDKACASIGQFVCIRCISSPIFRGKNDIQRKQSCVKQAQFQTESVARSVPKISVHMVREV